MGPSRTDAPHAARRDEPAAARAVLLHQPRFTCDPAGLHVVACSTSVTCSTLLLLQHFRHLQHFSSLAALPSLAALFFSCSTSFTCSTFLLLQHILHLQHVFTCDPPTLHVLPAVPHRSRHPPSCTSYRPSCDCSTCGPPTSACCTCTAPAFFLFHGTCSQHERTAAPASTAPPDTTRCCACVFLSVPRQMRLFLSTFGTEVSSPPLRCTPRDGAAAPAAGDKFACLTNVCER